MPSSLECVVPGCDYTRRSFKAFRFPTDPVRCRKWTEFCNRDPVDIPKGSNEIVCDRHFKEDDYKAYYQILRRPRKEWRLKDDAIPTLFGPEGGLDRQSETINSQAPLPNTSGSADCPTGIPEDPLEITDNSNLHQEVETEDFSRKCRLCLKCPDLTDAKAVDLFQKGTSYANFLLSHFQLQLEECPGWPSMICGLCVDFIGQIKAFKEMVVNSHCELFSALVENKKNSPVEIKSEPEDDYEPREKIPRQQIDVDSDVEILQIELSDSDDERTGANDKEDSQPQTKEEFYRKYDLTMKKDPVPRDREKDEELEREMEEMGLLKCHDCSEDHPSMYHLKVHMRRQHNTKEPFIFCCNAIQKLRVPALDHVEFHRNPDAFKCPTCGLRLKSNFLLSQHIRFQHSEAAGCQCSICGKTFRQKKSLNHHSKRHMPLDQRPFKCSYCGKGFVSQAVLTTHVHAMHEVMERAVCEICGKGYSNMKTFMEHYRTMHKGKESK